MQGDRMAKKESLQKHIKRTLDQALAASKALAAPAKPPGRGSPQFVLRYTPEMRDKIARLAKANGLSINSQLIALLERALNYGDDVEQLQQSMGEIFDRVERLESLVDVLDALRTGRDPYNVEK